NFCSRVIGVELQESTISNSTIVFSKFKNPGLKIILFGSSKISRSYNMNLWSFQIVLTIKSTGNIDTVVFSIQWHIKIFHHSILYIRKSCVRYTHLHV